MLRRRDSSSCYSHNIGRRKQGVQESRILALGPLFLLALVPSVCVAFKPFSGVAPFRSVGGREAKSIVECANDKSLKRLRDGFESEFQPEFGWVETLKEGTQGVSGTQGLGLTVTAGQKNCFFLLALTSDGAPFDRGCAQRAFFSAYLTTALPPTCQVGSSSNKWQTQSSEQQCQGGDSADRWPRRESGNATESEDLELATHAFYHPQSGLHSICYKVPAAGFYRLSVYLRYTNAFVHWLPKGFTGDGFQDGFVGAKLVLSRHINVVEAGQDSSKTSKVALQSRPVKLPPCSLKMLREHWEAGAWKKGLQWSPTTCELGRVTPQQAMTCLSRKREVLLLGDEQTATLLVVLHAYLNAPSRIAFSRALEGHLGWTTCQSPGIFRHCRAIVQLHAKNPKNRTKTWKARYALQGFVGEGNTKGKGATVVTFFADGCKGFLRFPVSRWVQSGVQGVKAGFNLSFIAHVGGTKVMIPPWILSQVDPSRRENPRKASPFQAALYGAMASESMGYKQGSFPGYALPKLVLPELLRSVGNPGRAAAGKRLTILGPFAPPVKKSQSWIDTAAKRGQKSTEGDEAEYGLTLPRLSFFEASTKVVTEALGLDVFLPALLLSSRSPPVVYRNSRSREVKTSSVSDRCANSFAAIELWLSLLCSP